MAHQRLFSRPWNLAPDAKELLQQARLSVGLVITTLFACAVSAEPTDDAYIAGYAAGILQHDLHLKVPSLAVHNGVITLPIGDLSADERTSALSLLAEIPGVIAVKPSAETKPKALATAAALDQPRAAGERLTHPSAFPTGILPTGHLFQPLLADPRWAHFGASYRNYIGQNIDGHNNASVSFGETLSFYRAAIGHSDVLWETGLQAGVFSDFNLDAESADLVNSDFIVSAYAAVRAQQLSAFGRIYHQSSHLGDEFVLRTRLERVNLSYEGVDLKLSYDLPYGFRVYGGGAAIFSKDPASLATWSTQYGVEFRSPWRMESVAMTPIFAVDIKNFEQNNWHTDVSARAGFQFDNLQTFDRKLQFLIEYFNGSSPTGQFYKSKVEYVGIGAHYHF